MTLSQIRSFGSNKSSTPDLVRSPKNAKPQKYQTGLSQLWHTAGFSFAGLRAGWSETTFRQEALAAMLLMPAAL